MAQQNPEFALHVHKKTATAGNRDLYTIGVWNGPTLHAICHVQPLDQALRVLRKILEQSGKPQEPLSNQQGNAATGTQMRGFRRLAAAILASISGFIKSAL
jgi:hypothetical protein